MPGEIRDAMAKLRQAKGAMIADMLKEIDSVQSDIAATHVDGLDAMKLPRAELDATKQEIREIRAEFAPSSNGGPSGPLPDVPNVSPPPPVNSAPSETPPAPETQSAEKKT